MLDMTTLLILSLFLRRRHREGEHAAEHLPLLMLMLLGISSQGTPTTQAPGLSTTLPAPVSAPLNPNMLLLMLLLLGGEEFRGFRGREAREAQAEGAAA